MNRHKNARTTFYGRALMVRRVHELGWPAPQAAEAAGVSVRTVRKWLAHQRAEGAAGLLDRSSRPHSSPPRIAAGWQTLIVRLRQCQMTAEEIASRLHLARSTVAAEPARLGLNRLSALTPKGPARRYERARPGDLVHLDVKKLASTSPAIASPGPGTVRTTASAGSSSTSASTTMPGSPMSRSWTTRPATAVRASSPGQWSGSPVTASACAAS
jgi:hypothetical protein